MSVGCVKRRRLNQVLNSVLRRAYQSSVPQFTLCLEVALHNSAVESLYSCGEPSNNPLIRLRYRFKCSSEVTLTDVRDQVGNETCIFGQKPVTPRLTILPPNFSMYRRISVVDVRSHEKIVSSLSGQTHSVTQVSMSILFIKCLLQSKRNLTQAHSTSRGPEMSLRVFLFLLSTPHHCIG